MTIRHRAWLAHFARGAIAGAAIHNFGWWVLAFLAVYGLATVYIEELKHREQLGKLSESWRRLMDTKPVSCRCARCRAGR